MAGLFAVCRWSDGNENPVELGRRLDALLALGPRASWERCTRIDGAGAAIALVFPGPTLDRPSEAATQGLPAAIRAAGPSTAAILASGAAEPGLARLLADSPRDVALLPFPYLGVRCDGRSLDVHLDELGTWPCYARRTGPRELVVGTSALALAALPPRADLDARGVVELLTFGQLLGPRSLFEGVIALAPGSRTTFTSDGMRAWTCTAPDRPSPPRPLRAAASSIHEAIETAVRSAAPAAGGRAGLLLSGGLDSRLLAAHLVRQRHPVNAITFGEAGCADIRLAGAVAGALGIPHVVAPSTHEAYARVLRHAAALTDGHVPASHFLGTEVLPALRAASTAQWNGFAGDAILGGSFVHPRYAWPGDLEKRLFRALNGVLAPDELGAVLVRDAATKLAAHPRRALGEALDALPRAGPEADRARRFLLAQRVGRLAAAGLAIDRHYLPVVTPFAQEPVLRVMHELRLAERRYGRALAGALAHHPPELGRIVWQRTGALPGAPWPIAAGTRFVWRGLARTGLRRAQTAADYGAWLDGPLRPFVRDVLEGGSMSTCALFDPPAMARLAREPVRDARRASLLGVLLSIAAASDILVGHVPPEGELVSPDGR